MLDYKFISIVVGMLIGFYLAYKGIRFSTRIGSMFKWLFKFRTFERSNKLGTFMLHLGLQDGRHEIGFVIDYNGPLLISLNLLIITIEFEDIRSKQFN